MVFVTCTSVWFGVTVSTFPEYCSCHLISLNSLRAWGPRVNLLCTIVLQCNQLLNYLEFILYGHISNGTVLCWMRNMQISMLTEWDVHFDVGAFSIWKIGWKEARSYKHGRIFPILWGEPWVPPHLFDCKPRSVIKLQKRLRRRFSECWHQNDSMIVKDDYFWLSLRCTSLESVCHTNMAFAFCKFRGVIQRSF